MKKAAEFSVGASILALAALSAGTAAHAQDTDEGITLEEVVVTARQRSENLQDTPFSIVAVSEQQLKAQNIRSTMDLDNKVPGLVLRPDNNRLQPFIGIRGVGDISRNPGIDTRTGIYLDGVPLGRSTSVNYPIFDVESVEILRGPQGTLFGNNSMTGVVSITSQKPKQEESSRVTLEAASRNRFAASGYLNVPVTDTLAARITLAGSSRDGWYKNNFDGSTIGGGTNFAARLQLRWTPTPDTIVDLSADAVRAKDDILLGVGQYTTGPQVGLPKRQVSHNFKPTRDREIYGVALNIEHKLPGDFTLTSISSYRTSTDALTYDGDGSPLSLLDVRFNYDDSAISQELRIASPKTDLYDYVVGAFYYRQNPGLSQDIRFGPDFPTVAARGSIQAGNGSVESEQTALFAHGTLRPLPWLALDGGLRWQRTTKSGHKFQAATATAVGVPSIPSLDLSLSESSVNPLVSVTVTPWEGVNLYALYSTGDRAGGFNMEVVRSVNGIQFGSESVVNYEAGIKSELFNRRLRLNIAAYSMRFEDFQQAQNIVDPNPPPGTVPTIISVISNAAKVKSEGVEVDFLAQLTSSLRVFGGFGFNHAWFQSFPGGGGPGVDYSGNRLIEAPRFQGSITVDYTRQLTEEFEGRLTFTLAGRTDVFSQPANNVGFNDDRYVEGGYGEARARFSVINRSGNLEFGVFANNLFDEEHNEGASPNAAGFLIKQLNEPRTIGVELTLRR